MLTAVISALAAILGSAGAILITKYKEREAIWRAKKLTYYEEFIAACSGTVSDAPVDDAKIRFATAINNLHLIGSARVVEALHAFCDEIAESNQHKSRQRHDLLWSSLVWEIRADLGEAPTKSPQNFRAILWTSGVHREKSPTVYTTDSGH